MRRKIESIPRYFIPSADHFFLFGPCGTGKPWLTKRLFPQALRVDLLEPETLRSLSARPERLRELIGARPEVRQVVIDEVQKLPTLLEVAHLLIEDKQGAQFIFTGSSARKLRRRLSGKPSLAAVSGEGAIFARQHPLRTLRGVPAATETRRVPNMTILETILKS